MATVRNRLIEPRNPRPPRPTRATPEGTAVAAPRPWAHQPGQVVAEERRGVAGEGQEAAERGHPIADEPVRLPTRKTATTATQMT